MNRFEQEMQEFAKKTKSIVRRALFLGTLEDMPYEKRQEIWPAAPKLETKHIKNCRLVEDRYKLLDLLPKNAVCAEIGIWHGDYSQQILEKTQPTHFHLFEINQKFTDAAKVRFATEIDKGVIEVHLGDSAEELGKLPDHSLDWIYIDGDHSLGGVRRDLETVRKKIKPNGLIALNDYVSFSQYELIKYGVIEAVNEFCLTYGYELLYYVLNEHSYNDVVLRKIIADDSHD